MVNLWPNVIIDIILPAVSYPFRFIGKFFDSISGSWDTYLTMFTIFNITRFLMGAIMGSAFGAGVFKLVRSRGSDRARRSKED